MVQAEIFLNPYASLSWRFIIRNPMKIIPISLRMIRIHFAYFE